VFVHLFRSDAEFERRAEELGSQSGDFDDSREYRQKLAAGLGLARFNELPQPLNPAVGPAGFYPELGGGAQAELERIIRNGKKSPLIFWPQLTALQDGSGACYNGFVPTEILEDAALVERYRMFEVLYLISDRFDKNTLMLGSRGAGRHLIAFWGTEKVFRAVEARLNAPAKGRSAPATGQPRWKAACLGFAAACALFGSAFATWELTDHFGKRVKASPSAGKAEPKMRCYIESMGIKKVSTPDGLPVGIVESRYPFPCNETHPAHWVLQILTDPKRNKGQVIEVPQAVYSRVRLGDELPSAKR